MLDGSGAPDTGVGKTTQHPPDQPVSALPHGSATPKSAHDRQGAGKYGDDRQESKSVIQSKVRFEDIAGTKAPGGGGPSRFDFTPDGRHLTYLDAADGGLAKELFALDLQSGEKKKIASAPGGGATEENLSLEEKLRRERSRAHDLGLPGYSTAEDGTPLLFSLVGELWFKPNLDGEMVRLIDRSQGPALDARLSRDGSKIAFVRGGELHVVSAKAGATAKQVSKGPNESGISRAVAEYVAQEEMDRHTGYWLAPDGQSIAYTQVDERHIPLYRIMHQGEDAVGPKAQEDHRYPFTGQANAKVSLWLTNADGGQPRAVALPVDGFDNDYYLARVQWTPGNALLVQVQNREQSELRLARVDPKSGKSTVLLREVNPVWVNLQSALTVLKHGEGAHADAFLWLSERSGFRHIYLYDANGKELAQLTNGDWAVDNVVAVDEKRGKVYFHSSKDDPTQRHLFEVGLDGKGLRQVTSQPGSHVAVLDPNFVYFVDTWSGLDQPAKTSVCKLADSTVVHELFDGRNDPKVKELGLTSPQVQKIKSRDGETLYVAVLRPDPAIYGPGPYPTLVSVYGGPHVQRVTQNWMVTSSLREQFLQQNGYLVLRIDNRGTSGRGLNFEGKIKHDLGNLEVQDQVDGVRWAVEEKLADPQRVGIFGWSYGGYMAAIALARAPETFKIAIAGAPVTHWDGYDTHYTERYMGLPAKNPEGYKRSSVMEHVPNMQGTLLLVHGLLDENVHFRHSARLLNAMIAARKSYELLLFPDARHGPRKTADRLHLEERIYDFIARKL